MLRLVTSCFSVLLAAASCGHVPDPPVQAAVPAADDELHEHGELPRLPTASNRSRTPRTSIFVRTSPRRARQRPRVRVGRRLDLPSSAPDACPRGGGAWVASITILYSGRHPNDADADPRRPPSAS